MRIIAGEHRGRTLVAPEGQLTRPTADKTRQALFNVLDHAPWAPPLDGARVIDLFAGSGALGLEALSRGAAHALFLDAAAPALQAISRNIASLRLESRAAVVKTDAKSLGACGVTPFTLAFVDPPYGQGLCEPALARLAQNGWLMADALAVVERGMDEPEPLARDYDLVETRSWGAARIWFLKLSKAS